MFEVGEIIVCVNDGSYKEGYTMGDIGLTIGKSYEVIEYKGKSFNPIAMVHIINDRNESQTYHTYRFVSLAEYRKIKINKIKNGILCI